MEIRHHAYLLCGDHEEALEEALRMSSQILRIDEDTDPLNHPDFRIFNSKNFSIKDARRLKEDSSQKSFGENGRIFVVRADIIMREAANALLKIFEEPQGERHFFIVAQSEKNIPETLLSRLMIIRIGEGAHVQKEKIEFAREFLGLSFTKRIAAAQSLAVDKENIAEFIASLEHIFREKLLESATEDFVVALDELSRGGDMMFTRYGSPKMVLEHLALVLPRP